MGSGCRELDCVVNSRTIVDIVFALAVLCR